MGSSTLRAYEPADDWIRSAPIIARKLIVHEGSLIIPRSSRKPIGLATPARYACASRWCGDKAGVCLLEWRKLVCGVMIVIVPASMAAQGTDRALLHSDGGTWLNGKPAPASSAIFPNDYIQTQTAHSAKIDVEGSTVMMLPDTVVQFEGDELVLDHGSLQLNTARQLKVRVNCITVIPVTADWTRYDVSDVDDKIKVSAYKKDVRIHAPSAARRSKQTGSIDNIVHEGERTTRDEKCGGAARPAADKALLNSPVAIGGGVGLIALTCIIICRSDDPVSPSKP
jgi:hypothetical protein